MHKIDRLRKFFFTKGNLPAFMPCLIIVVLTHFYVVRRYINRSNNCNLNVKE